MWTVWRRVFCWLPTLTEDRGIVWLRICWALGRKNTKEQHDINTAWLYYTAPPTVMDGGRKRWEGA